MNKPISVPKWLQDNKSCFLPPICNKLMYVYCCYYYYFCCSLFFIYIGCGTMFINNNNKFYAILLHSILN